MTDEEQIDTGVAIIKATQTALEGLTDNIVTFAVVGTVLYMVATGMDIPEWIQAVVAMIVAFYYKQ
jgi:hypothetical protein